jgi:hypothetical protein
LQDFFGNHMIRHGFGHHDHHTSDHLTFCCWDFLKTLHR